MPRTVVATDDFNRPNGSLGSNWGQIGQFAHFGEECVIHNQRVDVSGAARWIGAGAFTANQYAKAKVFSLDAWNAHVAGVLVRGSADQGANRDHYYYYVQGAFTGSYTTALAKVVNGSVTILDDTPGTVAWNADNDSIEIEAEGTAIRGFRNGVELHSATDSDLTTGSPGLLVYGGSGNGLGPVLDDWEGGNITAAGGTTYNVSLSESGSAAESISAVLGAVASLSENASAAESLTATTALVAALAESATAADLVNSGQQVSASLSEAATAADAITALLSASAALTEAASAADSLTAALAQSVSLTESVAASDVLSAVTQLVAALSEAISASDTMTVGAGQVYSVSISESATTADALSAALLALAQLAESASSAEQLSAIASLQAALTEAGSAVEALSSIATLHVSVIETGSAAEVLSGTGSDKLPVGRWVVRIPGTTRTVIVPARNRMVH